MAQAKVLLLASRLSTSPSNFSVQTMRLGLFSATSRAVSQTPQYRRVSSIASAEHSSLDLPPAVSGHGSLLPAEGELLRYHVSRTKSKELPVYHDIKSGGNRKLTMVRKIAGDVGALKKELQQALGLKDDRISINSLTKHIVIKGWHKPSVVRFLESRNL